MGYEGTPFEIAGLNVADEGGRRELWGVVGIFEGEEGRAWVLAIRPFLTLGEGPLSGGRDEVLLCCERSVRFDCHVMSTV